jgi:hypothetical protein
VYVVNLQNKENARNKTTQLITVVTYPSLHDVIVDIRSRVLRSVADGNIGAAATVSVFA